MIDGMTVTSISASLQHQTSVATLSLYHIVLNQKIIAYNLNWTTVHKFEKLCKFSSHIKHISRKKKLHKKRPTYF